MNNARIESLLDRQKKHLLADTLYALVVTVGLIVYVFGIGSSPIAMAKQPVPAPEVVLPAHAELADDTCTPAAGDYTLPSQTC